VAERARPLLIGRILNKREVTNQLKEQGVDVVGDTARNSLRSLADIAKWREIITAAGIKIEKFTQSNRKRARKLLAVADKWSIIHWPAGPIRWSAR
jgi:predicted xylose isomerase-like sugar epimerase